MIQSSKRSYKRWGRCQERNLIEELRIGDYQGWYCFQWSLFGFFSLFGYFFGVVPAALQMLSHGMLAKRRISRALRPGKRCSYRRIEEWCRIYPCSILQLWLPLFQASTPGYEENSRIRRRWGHGSKYPKSSRYLCFQYRQGSAWRGECFELWKFSKATFAEAQDITQYFNLVITPRDI